MVFNYFRFYLVLFILILRIFDRIKIVLIMMGLLKFYEHDLMYLKVYESVIYDA